MEQSLWAKAASVLFAFCFSIMAYAEVAVPALKSRVTDLTGTLTAAQRASLEDQLKSVETQNGSQLAVLIVPTTQPESIEQYSMRVVEAWKLGKAGADNGLLLLVSRNDRRMRIEVGYGLEGVIPDVVAWRVINEIITPRFKQGDFAGGISAGMQRIADLIEGRPPAKSGAKAEAGDTTCSIGTPTFPRSSSGNVFDLTETVPQQQVNALNENVDDYGTRHGSHIFVLAIASTLNLTAADYAQQTLAYWKDADNLDTDNTVLLLVSQEEGKAIILPGAVLQTRIEPGALERAVDEHILPQLKQGNIADAIQTGVQQIEQVLDAAGQNKSFGERLIANISELPIWFLIVLAVVGTALRWFLGPLLGGAAMGGLTGGGTWLISGEAELGMIAAAIGFIFVLVGITNWIALGLSSSSGSGGGFSGGGGGFGGGGASGSW